MRPGFINSFEPSRAGPSGGALGTITPFDYYHLAGNSGFTARALSRGTASTYATYEQSSATSGDAYAMPFWVGSSGVIVDTLGVQVGGTFGSNINIQLGIYDNAPFGAGSIYPRNLLTSATISGITSDGMRKTFVSYRLSEGLYWLAFIRLPSSLNSATFFCANGTDVFPEAALLGYGTDGATRVGGYFVTAQSSLPSTFPSGASFASSASNRPIAIFVELL